MKPDNESMADGVTRRAKTAEAALMEAERAWTVADEARTACGLACSDAETEYIAARRAKESRTSVMANRDDDECERQTK